MTKDNIDPKVFDLYDEYCHTQMTRRDFLNGVAIGAGGLLLPGGVQAAASDAGTDFVTATASGASTA